ncbi:hypothetical protein L207DRAFT_147648 [Hyaloscypha variabilis F]|uniref:Uncharacterized protein n=1 Tax=Hyaloscypha variabilis (strain UAMH 11265 / GT02V1 / F) TaxID=1149755 RepID=A0A2J6R5T3_HYAVF|nr:hypothetical protein L207DRAFT_147648 [Hyaloscypha variabilis F]
MTFSLPHPRRTHHPTEVSRGWLAAFAVLSMLMISVLSMCLKRRIQATRDRTWTNVPPTTWIIFVIYADSIVFVVGTAILVFGFTVNSSTQACSSTSLLCLICYMSTKFIYYYLVEKIYITRKLHESRFKSKLYCFNIFFVLALYCVVITLNVVHQYSYVSSKGVCIIGVNPQSLIVFIILDSALNLYLTILFVIPLREICTHSQARNPLLRTMCLRSLLCCFLTLITTTTNLGVILGLNGEPAWIFLLCCNLDVVFSVLIRRWVTLKGPQSASTSCSPEEAMVDESSVAAPSFSSSQTAQNMHAEVSHRELVMDQNGKIIEVEVQREATAEGATDVEDELSLQFSPTSPKPPNSLSTDKFCFSGLDLKDDGFEDEDDDEEPPEQQQQQEIEAESIGRAIITTHISAQKMHDADFDGCFRLNQGDSFLDIDAAGKMKLGGIRVMIEQVVEVEYESDNGL